MHQSQSAPIQQSPLPLSLTGAALEDLIPSSSSSSSEEEEEEEVEEEDLGPSWRRHFGEGRSPRGHIPTPPTSAPRRQRPRTSEREKMEGLKDRAWERHWLKNQAVGHDGGVLCGRPGCQQCGAATSLYVAMRRERAEVTPDPPLES